MATKENSKDGKVFKGTASADNLTNYGNNVTINAGKGNDSIDNYGSKVSIDGGAGNDTIWSGYGSNITINAGKGNDSIQNGGDNVLIIYSGGNDYISGFNETSTLQIASGTMNSVITTNGSDYFLTVGKNVVTLEGAAWLENYDSINIINSKSKAVKYKVEPNFNFTKDNDSVTNYLSNVTLDALGGNDTIANEGSNVSINGGAGNDSIENTAVNVTIDGGTGDDTISNYSNNVKINAGKGNDSVLNNGDEVSIDGGAGDDFIKNEYNNVSISGGKGNNTITNHYGSNVLFKYDGGNDYIEGFNSSSALQIASGTMNFIVTSNGWDYFVTVDENVVTLEGAAWLEEYDGINIINSKGKAVKFKVEPNFNFTKGNDSVTNYLSNVTLDALGGNDSITNYAANVSINGGKGNDSIYNPYGSNNVTINGGAGDDSIENYGDNILFVYSGGNDSISGFDAKSTLQIASDDFDSVINTDGSDYFLTVGKKTITLENVAQFYKINIVNSKGKALNYSLKMVDNQFNSEDSNTVKGTANRDMLKNFGNKVTVLGYAGDDTVRNEGKNVSIDGGAGNDNIDNYNSKVTISGGKGNDFIRSNGSKVSINGDTGNDLIENFGSKVTIVGGEGNDSIFNNELEIWDSGTYKTTLPDNVTINGGAGDDYIENYGSKVSINGGAGNDLINSDYEADKVTLRGGDGDDTLQGSSGDDKLYGDKGNDSLWGGLGDDSLYGGSGKDTFIYKPGEGTDIIFDYSSSDMLKILNEDGTNGSFTKSKYSGGDLTLTINGGGKIIFDNVSTGDKFNINGKTYTLGASKLK